MTSLDAMSPCPATGCVDGYVGIWSGYAVECQRCGGLGFVATIEPTSEWTPGDPDEPLPETREPGAPEPPMDVPAKEPR